MTDNNDDNASNIPCIGIDLGTTFSVVSVYEHGRAHVIANDMGDRTTPSVVSFVDNERLVGAAATAHLVSNPGECFYGIKRLIGRTIDDPIIATDIAHWPFNVVGHAVHGQQRAYVSVNADTPTTTDASKLYAPEEISAMVLDKLKTVASDYLGRAVTRAVITVPAHFNDAQRQATLLAGQLAGLDVCRIINEPTAAALAYGLDKLHPSGTTATTQAASSSNIMVFDFGGGTLDVTIMRCMQGVFKVLATAGNTHLGGEDLDMVMIDHCLDTWMTTVVTASNGSIDRSDIHITAAMTTHLRIACEKAKRLLSQSVKATVHLPNFWRGHHLKVDITRARFETLARDVFARCMAEVTAAVDAVHATDAHFTIASIDHVVLVGGGSRIPKMRSLLDAYCGLRGPDRQHSILCHSVNPDEVVAQGAAIQAEALTNPNTLLNNILLVDVTPLSLGVQVSGGLMDVLIQRNTTIPASGRKIYSTTVDNQPSVSISVYEGERAEVKHCRKLGYFEMLGIPILPRGKPKVEVCFDLDANGILTVSAKDTTTGKSKQMTITSSDGHLSHEDIARMIRDAEQFREQDRTITRRAQLLNTVDMFIAHTRDVWNTDLTLAPNIATAGTKLLADTEAWIATTSPTVNDLEMRYQELTDWFNRNMHTSSAVPI